MRLLDRGCNSPPRLCTVYRFYATNLLVVYQYSILFILVCQRYFLSVSVIGPLENGWIWPYDGRTISIYHPLYRGQILAK